MKTKQVVKYKPFRVSEIFVTIQVLGTALGQISSRATR